MASPADVDENVLTVGAVSINKLKSLSPKLNFEVGKL
jgi:hypothetical protein